MTPTKPAEFTTSQTLSSLRRAPFNLQLFRGELGFNGLITADSTTMGNLTNWGPAGWGAQAAG